MRGKEYIRENLLTILMVVGVVLGIVIGIVLHTTSSGAWSSRNVMYMQYLGDLFLQMLRGLVLPLIISSLVAAVSSMDMSMSGRIGGLAVAYYMLTTILAIILGIILAITIKPGVNHSVEDGGEEIVGRNTTTADTLLDLVRNLFPPNYIQACLQQYQTHLIPPSEDNTEALADINLWKLKGVFVDSTNILGLVVASIVFGIALSSPVGVLFLICAKFIEAENLTVFTSLGIFFVTVLGGVLFHGFAVLPLIYYILTRKNPYILIRHMGQAMATGFGTSSSTVTIPVTMRCLEENHGIDPRVTRFMVPIGAAINMDGTALYEAVAVIFIAQMRSIPLSFVDILIISLAATAASIGTASIPQAGIVALVMVLDVVGLPAEDIGLILTVDWLLGRFRTVTNILGDVFGVGIITEFSKNFLKKLDTQEACDNTEHISS